MRLIPHIRFYQPGSGFNQTGNSGFQRGDTLREFQRKQDDPSFYNR